MHFRNFFYCCCGCCCLITEAKSLVKCWLEVMRTLLFALLIFLGGKYSMCAIKMLAATVVAIGLSELCWIIVVKLGTLVLFLILKEMLSVFHHLESCLPRICQILPLLCWGSSIYAHFLGSFFFYHKCMLNFVESFSWIYWDYHMVFILQFINMVYCNDWFACTEESLHPWDKFHLIVVYDPLLC